MNIITRTARILAATVAVAVAALGLSATAASAATTTAPNVKACFYYANGGGAVTNAPTTLYEAAPTATKWTGVRSGTNNSVGCITFVGVHRGYYYHVMLHKVIGNTNYGMFVYDGATNVGITGSTGTLGLTGWVTVRCIPGVYANPCG